MYKRVDIDGDEKIVGYSYQDRHGDIESVEMLNDEVEVRDSLDGCVNIYYQDIPKLIKALQMAYDNKQEKL